MRSVPTHFLAFSRVALNGLDLRECFVRGAGRFCDAILHSRARFAKCASKHERRTDDDWYYGESRRSKTGIGEDEKDDAADQKERLSRELGQIVAEYRLQNGRVRGQSTCQLTGASFGEEPRRKSDQMRKEILAQLRNHQLRCRREQINLDEIE